MKNLYVLLVAFVLTITACAQVKVKPNYTQPYFQGNVKIKDTAGIKLIYPENDTLIVTGFVEAKKGLRAIYLQGNSFGRFEISNDVGGYKAEIMDTISDPSYNYNTNINFNENNLQLVNEFIYKPNNEYGIANNILLNARGIQILSNYNSKIVSIEIDSTGITINNSQIYYTATIRDSSNYNVVNTDVLIFKESPCVINDTVTLWNYPEGKLLFIKRINNQATNTIIKSIDGETIDGLSSISITGYEGVTLIRNNSKWYIIK